MSDVKEIGGYIELERFHAEEYHSGLVAVNSARNALRYVIEAKSIRKIYIPYLLCACVWETCRDALCAYEFYHTDRNFRPVFEKKPGEGEYLYIVNYYGQISNEELMEMKSRYGNVIFDNVQDFFRKPVPGIDTVYSCRKFFGVPDGGYLSTDVFLPEPMEVDVSMDRMVHLLGRLEHSAAEYYGEYTRGEAEFDGMPLRAMSRLTENLLRGIDYESVRLRRNRNFAVLDQALGKYNRWMPASPDGPYCYPLLVENGPEIRRQLVKQKIYIPTLWPDVFEIAGADDIEKGLASNVLPIPCDQRYSPDDMAYTCKLIREYLYP